MTTDKAELKIVIAQLNCWVGDVNGNTDKAIAAALTARDEFSADLVVLPELCLTGYPPEDLLLRPAMRTRIDTALDRLLTQVEGIHIVIGYPEYNHEGIYNSAAVIRDGQIVANYRKHLLPNYSVFDEKRYFQAGEHPCLFPVNGHRLGLTICEDIWAAGPALLAKQAGAELLININASPYHIDKDQQRQEVLTKRVSEIELPIVYANMVGGQDELVFDGASVVYGREGEITHRCPSFVEGLYPVTFNPMLDIIPSKDVETASKPALSLEATVYLALVTGLRDYVLRNGFPGVVIGLSGGIDSALTLAIAVDALGPDKVHAVMMPSEFTSEMSLEDAAAQADLMGVRYDVVSIIEPVAGIERALEEVFAGRVADVTEENIQARCRGVLLMAISNKFGSMVITTGNKSEMAVGYSTLYGDMVGGFAPLKDISKTLVFALARYRNARGRAIPERVISRPPSAELRPDQKDSDTLPPYQALDPILKAYIEQDRHVAEIVAMGYDEAMVRKITKMVKRAEYKRRQAPPGIKVTARAFGRDRRYPITSGY